MAKLSRIIDFIVFALLLDNIQHPVEAAPDPLEDAVGTWAQQFGEELWELGQSVTKLSEIKARYKNQNGRVKQRTGEDLLQEIIENVQTMLKHKVDAVKCIMDAAEELAENFDVSNRTGNYTYYSCKQSIVNDKREREDDDYYDAMWLQPHRQFHNIPVNLSHSAVHLPTNLFDRSAVNEAPVYIPAYTNHKVMDAIEWSGPLSEVFAANYKSDPALYWQYFGHNTGFLNQFPAMKWNQEVDQYDFRFNQTYIDCATCTKDMVILMDTTGSMTGLRLNIAKLTVNNILDTLSNNDYVNVFNFSSEVQAMVPCFDDMLVQASPENVNTFKFAVNITEPEGHANFSVAFTHAFELLKRYREIRGCNESVADGPQCNQVIMLVTDGVPYNITEVFEEYNWLDNGTNIPVRVFTYLIGREVFQVKEIQLIACMNKGFYTHVHSFDEVREGVFEYIPVLARPLVLQGVEHPIAWTNVYADIIDPRVNEWLWDVMENAEQKDRMYKYFRNKKFFFSQQDSDRKYVQQLKKEKEELKGHMRYREYSLVMSVSTPAFNRTVQPKNETRTAELLGVAGTDIYMDHVQSLTKPYKIGVNGYAFIINNNGYIILHPDLRPVSRGFLKDNINSVDLTEVELLADDAEVREVSPEIVELRENMINEKTGKMELTMKYHYDDMHRVAVEDRTYFYAPMKGTPFSVGLSLPSKYGFNYLSVRDEVQRAQFLKTPLTNYFYGYNWKIPNDWVYCKYHHEHMFNSSTQELRHFLEKMSTSDWQWNEQYKPNNEANLKYSFTQEDPVYEFSHCTAKEEVDPEAYYCNKDLMLLLVSDAILTSASFQIPRWEFKNNKEKELIYSYNTTLRFIATHSGLTRWQYVLESDEKEYHRTEFGNLHKQAIDESWYKSAVLQHQIDPDAFVYSLAFDLIGVTEGDAMVTASHAIFHRDGGKEAPVSVVGMQFRQTALYDNFMRISSNPKCPECREQCSSEHLDCFILDSGGYILVSEELNDTGRFFGEVDGAIMEVMINNEIYQRFTIYDYQALCFVVTQKINDASILLTPFKYFQWVLQWVFGELMWMLTRTGLHQMWAPVASIPIKGFPYDLEEEYYDSVEIEDIEEEITSTTTNQTGSGKNQIEYITTATPCDQKIDLYQLNQDVVKNLQKGEYESVSKNCSRPFYVRRIPYSNLLLVVVDGMQFVDDNCNHKLSAEPEEVNYNTTYFTCNKIEHQNLTRRRLTEGCFMQHPLEQEITECGDLASLSEISIISLILCTAVILLTNSLQF